MTGPGPVPQYNDMAPHPGYMALTPKDPVAEAFDHPLDRRAPRLMMGGYRAMQTVRQPQPAFQPARQAPPRRPPPPRPQRGQPPQPQAQQGQAQQGQVQQAQQAQGARPQGAWVNGSGLNAPMGPRGGRLVAHRPAPQGMSPDGRQMQFGPMGQGRLLREMVHGHGEDAPATPGVTPVAYFRSATARAPYLVQMGAQMRRHGEVFDTVVLKKAYMDSGATVALASPGNSRRTGAMLPIPVDWGTESLIWVCAADPVTDRPAFYSHICRQHAFHHSSFTAGSDVIGAGEWVVRHGKLLRISPNSGHYRPRMDHFYHAVLHMATAFQPDTTVYLYDSQVDQFVDYPVRRFIAAPSMGGRLRVHPQG